MSVGVLKLKCRAADLPSMVSLAYWRKRGQAGMEGDRMTQGERREDIHCMAQKLERMIGRLCRDGREKSLAKTKLEECVMWAHAAIEREEPLNDEGGEGE